MSDPVEFLTLAVLASLIVGAWAAIRCCADAALHGGRDWWKVAIFKAEQRVALREFREELGEVRKLERMAARDEHP